MISELEAADIEAILAPIPGDQATGVDLRQDYSPTSLYFRLRDARAEARDAERRADGDGSVEGVATLPGRGCGGIGAITTGVLMPVRSQCRQAYLARAFCKTFALVTTCNCSVTTSPILCIG